MYAERSSYMMIAPFMIAFIIFTVLPVIASLVFGFTDFNMIQTPNWVGFDNYKTIFLNDDVFIIAVRNTLILAIITGPVGFIACYIFAWFINELPNKIRAVMTLIFIFQKPLLSLFTDSAEIAQMVFWCLVVDFILEFGRPFNLVVGVTLRGTGDVMWAMWASGLSTIFACILVGFVLTQVFHLGLYAVFIALLCDEWLRGQLMTYRWRTRKWEKYVIIKESKPA